MKLHSFKPHNEKHRNIEKVNTMLHPYKFELYSVKNFLLFYCQQKQSAFDRYFKQSLKWHKLKIFCDSSLRWGIFIIYCGKGLWTTIKGTFDQRMYTTYWYTNLRDHSKYNLSWLFWLKAKQCIWSAIYRPMVHSDINYYNWYFTCIYIQFH